MKEILKFDMSSRDHGFYAPFDIDSKNFMEVREETEDWCSRMAKLIEATVKISKAADRVRHPAGVA